jgi:aryl-alcohol dehydrogenase-like predicted oxidoreductase
LDHITVKGMRGANQIEIKCSQLILGTGDMFKLDIDSAHSLLDSFIQLGGNVIDMAHQYIRAEEIVGQWMKERGNRSEIKLLTKGAHPDDGEPGNRVNPSSITKDLLESLDRLNTNYIDLYALHRDDPNMKVGPIIEVLNEHLSEGRIDAIGASNWKVERIEEANEYAYKNGLVGFTFNSPNFSLAKANEPMWEGCISANHHMIEWHQERQMPLLSWSSQAGGFFTGLYTPENRGNKDMVRVYYNSTNWERFKRTEQLAIEKDATPIQIALGYVLNQSFPTAAIIGPRAVGELDSSVKGSSIKLKESEIDWLNFS